jgi:hypothetical protein
MVLTNQGKQSAPSFPDSQLPRSPAIFSQATLSVAAPKRRSPSPLPCFFCVSWLPSKARSCSLPCWELPQSPAGLA